jgi:hypothetical protein
MKENVPPEGQVVSGEPSSFLTFDAEAILTSLAVHWTFLPYSSFKQLFADAGVALVIKANMATNAVSVATAINLLIFLVLII